MSSASEIRQQILSLVARAESAIPDGEVPDLPPLPGHPGVPGWHRFEMDVWQAGEAIRQLMARAPSVRKDPELQEAFVRLSLNRNAKRGRQSFVMLLGYASCRAHAEAVASQIGDPAVTGHVISTLTKMRAEGFVPAVWPHAASKVTWIRNEAKRYIARYGGA